MIVQVQVERVGVGVGSVVGLGPSMVVLNPPTTLPSAAPVGGEGAATSQVFAAGLVLTHCGLSLLVTVPTVVVTMLLLVERY